MEKYDWDPSIFWARRTKFIAKLILPKVSVIDIGGGFEMLNKYLEECEYTVVDKFECTKRTIVADLNKDEFPSFEKQFNYIICQGVIEYIKDPKNFLKSIKKYGKILIITYRKSPTATPVWRNELTFKYFRKLLRWTNWEIIFEKEMENGRETLFYCRQKTS
jgi:hypothetical protein